MSYSIPMKTMDAQVAGSVADGTAIDQDDVANKTVMQWIIAYGTSCFLGVALYGSLDGTNWYNMVFDGNPDVSNLSGTNGQTRTDIIVSQTPARYVRGKISGAGTSTSATTVTLWVASNTE